MARKPLAQDVTPNVATIVDVFRAASPELLEAGMEWYMVANREALSLSSDVRIGAGVIAALSPQNGWTDNLRIARASFAAGEGTGNTGANNRKASAIIDGGEPMDILGGLKVQNFYASIIDPRNAEAVCIDRHAFAVAIGRIPSATEINVLSRVGVYDLFAEAYRMAARILSDILGEYILPSQVQAVTWVVWRAAKGIVD